MSAKYIFRLDDSSHFQDSNKWNLLEEIFDKHSINCLVAVTPNSKDPSINFDKKNNNYWMKVRSWEAKGWVIAMHGYSHSFHKANRKKSIFPYYNRSEFAELSLKKQEEKLKKSLDIFRSNGVEPSVWVAPGHTFDINTLKALKKVTNITIVSDGIAYSDYCFQDFTFVPQQLWSVEEKKSGIWTICLHPNNMTYDEIYALDKILDESQIARNSISILDIQFANKGRNISDCLYSLFFWTKYEIKLILKHFSSLFSNS